MNPATTIQTLRWFVRTSRGIRLRSIANTLTGVIGVGLDFAFIWATKRCIDTATHQTEGSLTESALLLGAVMASIIALGFARNWLAAILGVQSTNKIQRRMFETVLGSVWLGRDRQHTGDTMNRLDRDVRDVTSVISNTLPQALIVTCRLIGAFVFLCVYDARLACALMEARGFQDKDFARFHPGGSLGRKLLTTAQDVMRTTDLPVISPTLKLGEAIGRYGFTAKEDIRTH